MSKQLIKVDSIVSEGVDENCKYIVINNGRVEGTYREGEIDPGDSAYSLEDFSGYLMTPGFIDSHNHLFTTALQIAFGFDLAPEKQVSIDNLLSRIGEFSKDNEFPWIVGRGINSEHLQENRLPTRYDLDRAINDKPIFLVHQSGHAAVCNSAALKLAGLDKHFPDQKGGRIERDENGEPTGILHEKSAMDIVRNHIPQYTKENYKQALRVAQDVYLREGLTCVKDTGGNGQPIIEPQRIDAINEVEKEGSLKLRIAVALPIFGTDDMEEKIKSSGNLVQTERVTFSGYKIFLDGSGISKTAWVREDWNFDLDTKDVGNKGVIRWDLDDLEKVFDRVSALDVNISTHAIGDAAIGHMLNLIKKENGAGKKATYALVHSYTPSDEDLAAMQKYSVAAETQPSFIFLLGAQIANNLGRERYERMFPMRSYLSRNIRACISSDSPVSPFSPSYGIFSAMKRQIMNKKFEIEFINKSEAISFREVVKCYTKNPSEVLRKNDVGTLENGKFADLVIWDKRIADLSEEDVPQIHPKAVYVGGSRVA